jgi:integrase
MLNFCPAVVSGIFLAVDRCQMRRIFVEIRSPDSKLRSVCIDPFPQAFSGNPSLCPCRAIDAHDIGRKAVAIAAADWIGSVGLDPRLFGTHSLRRTKATLIYRRTGNLRAVQLLLGHTKIESTVRYLGIEVDDALTIAEQIDV